MPRGRCGRAARQTSCSPDSRRAAFVVLARKHRDVKFFARDGEFLGDQFPRPGNGFLLKVVAEGKVAEHFEEGVVARGAAHLLEVVVLAARAHALLRGRGARIIAALAAQEYVLELVHAGIGKQQRRVIRRHQRRRTHNPMAARLAKNSKNRVLNLV